MIGGVLGDTAFLSLIGSTAAQVISGALAIPEFQTWAGGQVENLVAGLLADNSAGSGLSAVVGQAVTALLANQTLSAGVGPLLGGLLPTMLSEPAVATTLAGAVGQIITAVLAGEDPVTALKAEAGPVIAVLLNAADTTLLSDPAVQQALGDAVTAVVTSLTTDPALRATIGDQLGPVFGPIAVQLLENPALNDLAAALGSTITNFLAAPGLPTALTGVLTQLADAVLNGTDITTALQDALQALQSQAAFQTAVGDTLPRTIDAILGNPQLRETFAQTAGLAVTGLLNNFGITSGLVNRIALQVTVAATNALLESTAVANLVGTVGVDFLTGSSLAAVTNTLLDAALGDWELQQALGNAVGQGIGALFGDNIVGTVVSKVVAFSTSALLAVTGRIARLFISTDPVSAAAAAAPPHNNDYFFELTGWRLSQTAGVDYPEFLDVDMTVDGVLVAARLRLDPFLSERAA